MGKRTIGMCVSTLFHPRSKLFSRSSDEKSFQQSDLACLALGRPRL